jgi:hypothetical protein
MDTESKWKHRGVRVVRANELAFEMNQRTVLLSLIFSLAMGSPIRSAHAQSVEDAAPASAYGFATLAEGRAILAARDDYVRATSALERSARLRTRDAVDEDRFTEFMRGSALDWTEEQQRDLRPLIARLDRFLSGFKWKRPGKILLVQVDATLEDNAPHTRANGLMLPKNELYGPALRLIYVLSHETFHVLTREDGGLREALYGAIGFRRCDRMEIPESISQLRITNPDAVENRHTIAVRYRGQPVEAMPFLRFGSDKIDTRAGFLVNSKVSWLLVDREQANCRVRIRSAAETDVAPQELQGLFEQVGRNTQYLAHPEEILADNFFQLFVSTFRGASAELQSPEILERMRAILFQ